MIKKQTPGHAKYITTFEYNTCDISIFDTKLKQANLVTNSDVNAVSQCNYENKEQTFDLTYFLGKDIFVDGGCQNMFVFEATFSKIDFKHENKEYKVSA